MAAIRLQRILVPVDFSPCSGAALDYAVFLATHLGAAIVIVHASGEPGGSSEVEALSSLDPEGSHSRLLAGLRERGFERAEARLALGPVDRVIVDEAVGDAIDLIVMGTHGRHGLRHLALGSIAEHVVRAAPCPVLTVRERHDQYSSEGIPSRK